MADRKIIVVFRYDDYTGTSPIEVEESLFRIFNDNESSLSVGVVPLITSGDYHKKECEDCIELSDEKKDLLKDFSGNGTVDVNLHGFNHNNCNFGGIPSEFLNSSYEEQYRKIKEGKEAIEKITDTKLTTFIPPWNTYDCNTLAALENIGFSCLSANRYGITNNSSQIDYLPITIEFKEINAAISGLSATNKGTHILSVLLHPYDFLPSGDPRATIDWSSLDEMLKGLQSNQEVEILTIGDCLKKCDIDLSLGCYRVNSPSFFENIFPPFIQRTYDRPSYRDKNGAISVRLNNGFKAVVFFLAYTVALLFLLKYSGLDRIIGNSIDYFFVLLSIITLSYLVYGLYKASIYFRKFIFLYTLVLFFVHSSV